MTLHRGSIAELPYENGAQSLLVGALGTVPRVRRSCGAYATFLQRWQTAPPVTGVADVRAQPPQWVGLYAYDAVRLLARAWANEQAAGRIPSNLSSPSLLHAIRSTPLPDTAIGNMTLDPTSGDRLEGRYDVYQFQTANGSEPASGLALRLTGACSSVSCSVCGLAAAECADGSSRLQFSPRFAQGALPWDGSQIEANASLVLSIPEARAGRQLSVCVLLRNGFQETVEVTSLECSLLDATLSLEGDVRSTSALGSSTPAARRNGTTITALGGCDTPALRRSLESAEPLSSAELLSTCEFVFTLPQTSGVYAVAATYGGSSLPVPRSLRVVTSSADAVRIAIAVGSGILVLILTLLPACFRGYRSIKKARNTLKINFSRVVGHAFKRVFERPAEGVV